MEIKKEDFERLISLAYQRGRVTPIRYIDPNDIEAVINDAYSFLKEAQQKDSADGLKCLFCGAIMFNKICPSCSGRVSYR